MKELGLKVMVSELDLGVVPRGIWWADGGKNRAEIAKTNPLAGGCPPELLERQARQYAELFQLFRDSLRVDRPGDLLGPPRRPELAEQLPLEARRIPAPVRPRGLAQARLQGGDGRRVNAAGRQSTMAPLSALTLRAFPLSDSLLALDPDHIGCSDEPHAGQRRDRSRSLSRQLGNLDLPKESP